MVDIDAVGGLPVIVCELLGRGLLDGETPDLHRARRWPSRSPGSIRPRRTATSSTRVAAPFKPTGGLRLLSGNLALNGGAVIKIAGVEGGLEDGLFLGRARVFDSEQHLIDARSSTPDVFADQRHGRDPLRGPAWRARHAGAAGPDVAHHRAVPPDAASPSR